MAETDAVGRTTHTEYDADGLPVKVTGPTGQSTSTAYDAMGRPVSVTDPAGRITQYTWNPGGRLTALTDPKGGIRRFSYNAAGRLQQATDCSGHATRYHYDALGQELVNEPGNVVWIGRYKAWGRTKKVWQQEPDRIEATNPIRFQGQYHDEETGLHYNRHRYYDPNTGRFISKDPIGLAGGVNVYAYAPNPTRWIDPLGLTKCTALATYWPPNNGAFGDTKVVTLQPGTQVDRYGYEGGSYVSPAGTPYGARALPSGSNEKPYNVFEVVQPIGDVEASKIAPWFGELGLGTQYKLPQSVGSLVESGHLKRKCGE